ncbi:hypothetical protein ABZ379_33830 [Streptomyces canus]|uniref:hypothetical protein n=1 Tax=Streptomyces canus TaxID=58343 RepID=UPI003402F605
MPRVDVEGSLLCDVLADGTVVGQALVEAVYDTSSGDRVGTRTVDPATGAVYTPQGTLQPCPPPDSCTCETLLLCDTTTTEVVTFLRHICRTCTGTATVTDTALDGTTTYVVQGEVGQCPTSDECGQFVGTLCYQEPTTQDPSFTLHKFDAADPNYPGCLVGLDAMDGDLPFIQYNDPITAWEGTYTSNTGTASNVEVSAPELGGFIDWSQFSPAIPSVPNAGIPAPYTGTAVFNGITVTLDVTTAQAITTGTQYLRMGGTETFKLSFSTGVTMKFGTQGFADPAAGNFERFCDVTATGVVTGTGEIRTAYGLRDCETGETTWRDQASGDDVDMAQAVVVPCPQPQRDCASPTEPTATVGLCLADGTPIAVTVIRDCAGTVTSEGWLNLVTGAYSTGAPPAGTVACGDSRSIQVSGTFCDIDAAGDVVGLVLIEYTYDDAGAISSVRLVDAVTGGTYTPTGTVTTCPAGVEQPEQDAVILCDTAANGTVTQFLRDFRRDENGAITGHSDYLLDGTAYTPAGTVGVCSSPCLNCETIELCDVTPGPGAWATVQGQAASETLPNGITVTWTRTLAGGGVVPDTNMRSWIPSVTGATSSLSASKPAQVRIGVSLAANQQLTLPPGSVIEALSPHHTYNPVTRVLTADATSAMTGDTSATANAATHITRLYLPRVAGPVQFTAATNGVGIGFDNIEAAAADPYPFLRTVCRGCDGAVISTTDTELDGTTAYTVIGRAGSCETGGCQHCETLLLCDDGADDTALIGGATSSGTLSNGITWQARGSAALQNPLKTNANGAWWNLGTFPNAVITPFTWTFNRPVDVEFSVVLWWSNATPTAASVQIPPNAEPVSLPPGYHYDPATRILSGDNTLVDCSTLNNPSPGQSARFRMRGAVTSFTLQSLGVRIAACGQFGNWWFGAIEVTPSGQFFRTICRDCDGTVTSSKDTGLDGVTPYTVLGAPKVCTPPEPADCCQPVQLCIADTVTETIEFISNEAQVYDNTVDTVWTWTPNGDANGPLAAATWYPTYKARYSVNPAAWSVVDTAPSRPAGWIAPHPNGLTANSGAPGEGPTISGPEPWWARASFSLPAAADPASIKVKITVLNADQQAIRFRLNSGAWTALPATATHNGTPYTYGPGTVAGAQPGTNTLYFEVNETLADAPGNGAGVMAHFIVTYDVPGLGQRSWTRMVCCDGTVYYIDEDGARQDQIPPSSSIVACGGSPDPLVLCDDNGTFLRHVSYVGEQIVTTDTDVNGSAYAPVGTVRSCAGTTATAADQTVSTGIARHTNDPALVDLTAAYPGLQSVTLTVLSGTVATGMTNTSGGSGIAIPAGVTMTWSVADTDDSSLGRALFQQQGNADYLLNWTWKATAAG